MKKALIDKLTTQLKMPVYRIEEYLAACTIVQHKRKQIIFPQNSLFDSLGYIIEGGARTYYIDHQGNEISYLLQLNGDAIGDYAKFISGQSSNLHIQFLIDSEVLYIQKNKLEQLIEKDPYWLGFAKYISDMAFLSAKQRLDELFFFNPEERYLNLLNKSPEVIQKIPQKYIASYLGITNPSLSRIKRRIY
jgi:CRP-like cAMP-binding protein